MKGMSIYCRTYFCASGTALLFFGPLGAFWGAAPDCANVRPGIFIALGAVGTLDPDPVIAMGE